MANNVLENINNILYAKEVQKYLESFAPLSAIETMGKIKDIWEKEGFLEPSELTAKLYKMQLTEKNGTALFKKEKLVDNIINAGSPKDKLTGFEAKPKTPLLTGLAHLYGLETGNPVAIVEGDFSNMGGTNNKYREEMKSSRAFDGFAECDLAARISARLSLEQLQELAASKNNELSSKGEKPNCKVFAVRSGGDEIRMIVTGIKVSDVDDFINAKVHPQIEEFTACAGLHDHPHTKDPTNPYRTGFGLAFAVDDLSNPKLDPLNIVEALDKRIKLAKLDLGYKRKGKVAPEIETAVRSEMQKQGIDAAKINQAIKMMRADALKSSAKYQKMKHGVAPLDFIHQARDDKQGETAYGKLANLEIKKPKLLFGKIKTEREFFENPDITRKNQVSSYLDMILGANKNDADRLIAVKALEATRDIDPPTGLNAVKSLYDDTDMFISDSKQLKKAAAEKGQILDEAKPKAVHIELGNLAGINEISHQHADAVLKDFADIAKKNAKELGLGDYDFAFYHEGGGKIKMLVPPYVKSGKDSNEYAPVSSDLVEKFSKKMGVDIEQRINRKPLFDYFSEKGLSVDDNDGKPLKLGNGEPIYNVSKPKEKKCFSDIPHPKRPWERGIAVTTVGVDLQPNVKGETQLKNLSLKAEALILKKRDNVRQIAQENEESAKRASSPELMKGGLLCKIIDKGR
ncbi:MAG: hypothetical protein AB7U85_05260 [Alphaproteobacteria bacterium]